MTTTMPTLNGIQPPPSPLLTSTAKRKRTDSHDHTISGTLHNEKESTNAYSDIHTGESIRNIYQILKSNDTSPSILQHSIPTSINGNAIDAYEPSAKRTKLSPSEATQSVAAKVQAQAYKSLEEFLSEVDASCSDLLIEARSKISGVQWEYVPNTLDQDVLIANITAFQELSTDLVHRELMQRKSRPTGIKVSSIPSPKGGWTNGVKEEGTNDGIRVDTRKSRAVLTLFGNAQGHKQLFSSFQKPIAKVERVEAGQNDTFTIPALTQPVVSVRENGLPNGISSTQMISLPYKNMAMGAKTATLLDVFPPPLSTIPLVPPKVARPHLARQNSITWTQSNGSSTPKNVIGYAHQKLTAGHWLGYDGVSPSLDAISPETKRKQRDRTLSTGESGSNMSEASVAAQTLAREDALFRSAYSSFAPCRDNTGVIFPEEAKNQLWWQKVGSRHMNNLFSMDPDSAVYSDVELDPALDDDDEEDAFREVVESFEPEVLIPKIEKKTTTVDKDGEELLEEVSEMLETLFSYQRIRNSCLNTNARSSVGQNPPLQDLMGSPSVPSVAEIETYNALRAQLVLIISLLPPHAVAKLDGEQLEELQISQSMPVEFSAYRGVMEDDQVARAAKAAAFSAAIGTTGMQPRQTAVMTPTALQYSSSQARTAQMTAPARSNSQQYYNGGVTPSISRQPSSFARQPLSNWQVPIQNYNGATPTRPIYNPQQSFGQQPQQQQQQQQQLQQQQTPRPLSNSTRPSLSQYPQQRSSSSMTPQLNGGSYQPAATTPSQPAYQQRAQNYANNQNYNFKPPYNSASYNASQTPQQQQQQQQQQQYSRPSYVMPPQSASPVPPTTASVMPGTQIGINYANSPRPQTPAALGQMNMGAQKQQVQAQSPGVAAVPAALMVGRSASGTPQP